MLYFIEEYVYIKIKLEYLNLKFTHIIIVILNQFHMLLSIKMILSSLQYVEKHISLRYQNFV